MATARIVEPIGGDPRIVEPIGGGPPKRYIFEGGKRRKMEGGMALLYQNGGAHLPLSPVSLSGDSFDRSGAQLANTAHAVYVQKNIDLASIKNVNAMKGGQTINVNAMKGGQMINVNAMKGRQTIRGGRRSRRTAKKYSRSKSSKSARRGGGLVEAVVPLGLLAAQQTLFKRGSSKNKRHNKYGGSRRRSRSRRN